MKKYSFKNIILLFTILVFAGSCNLEDTNIDPANPTSAELNLLLPDALAQSAYNQSATSARLSGIVMQQFFGFDAQQIAYNDYVIGSDVFDNLWRFGIYAGVLKSTNNIINIATENNNLHYRGIAKVLMGKELAFVSSMFGNVPFTEALQGTANIAPIYDSQEDVLVNALRLIDEGITDLNTADNSGKVPGNDDFIYGGDTEKWVKLANSLKARYLIMQSKKGASMDAVLTAVAAGFSSNDDNAAFPWESSLVNACPLAKFGNDRSGTLIADKSFYYKMLANNDPRNSKYLALSVKKDDDDNPIDTTFNWYSPGAGLIWGENNAPVPVMSFSELKFIEAEARHRKGESATVVAEVLKDAIDASVVLVTGDIDSTFSSTQSDLTGLAGDQIVEAIIDAAYYSYFGIAFQQSWDNYRRTGYPTLTSKATGSNGLNPSNVIPRRWLYPQGEETSNKTNLDAAISAQGGHLLDNDLWLFQ